MGFLNPVGDIRGMERWKIIMQIQQKSSSGITLVPIESCFLSSRRLFIEGEIDTESAVDFLKNLLYLTEQDQEKPITVLINSPGGQVNAGLLIYDAIQACPAPIRLFCIGKAYSMACLLLACGKKGQRYILPSSETMLHEPHLYEGVGGSASSIKSISDSILAKKRKINGLLVKHTGRSEEEIEQVTRHDHYLSAKESLEFGLVDEIVDFSRLLEV